MRRIDCRNGGVCRSGRSRVSRLERAQDGAYRGSVRSPRLLLRLSDLRRALLLQCSRRCRTRPCGSIDQGAAADLRAGNHGGKPRFSERAGQPAAAYKWPRTVGAGTRHRSPRQRDGSVTVAAVDSSLSGWTPPGRGPWNTSWSPHQHRWRRGLGNAKLAIYARRGSICQRLTKVSVLKRQHHPNVNA